MLILIDNYFIVVLHFLRIFALAKQNKIHFNKKVKSYGRICKVNRTNLVYGKFQHRSYWVKSAREEEKSPDLKEKFVALYNKFGNSVPDKYKGDANRMYNKYAATVGSNAFSYAY